MRVINKLGILLILLIFLMCSSVTAEKITVASFLTNTGYEISIPLISAFRQNENLTMHFQVFNRTNGVIIYENTKCYFEMQDPYTNILYSGSASAGSHYVYSFFLDAGNFTKYGQYDYSIHCNNTVQGGATVSSFKVNELGVEDNEYKGYVLLSNTLGNVLGLLGIMFFFVYLYSRTDTLSKLLRVLFLAAALFTGAVLLSVQNSVIDSQVNVLDLNIGTSIAGSYSMFLFVFKIIFVVFMLWLVINSLKAVLGKKPGMPGDE